MNALRWPASLRYRTRKDAPRLPARRWKPGKSVSCNSAPGLGSSARNLAALLAVIFCCILGDSVSRVQIGSNKTPYLATTGNGEKHKIQTQITVLIMIYCGLLLLADSVDLPLLHVRDVGVAGSNPAIPTNSDPRRRVYKKGRESGLFCVCTWQVQSASRGFSV